MIFNVYAVYSIICSGIVSLMFGLFIWHVYFEKKYGKIAMFRKGKVKFYITELNKRCIEVTYAWYLLPLPENTCIRFIYHIAKRRAYKLLRKAGIKPKKVKWRDVKWFR